MSSRNILCWVDIPVADLPRAIKFYSTLLAAPVEHQAGPGFEFGVLPHAGEKVSGCLVKSGNNRPGMTGPLIYISVEGRLDEAVEIARQAGGLVLGEREAIGPYGFRAIVQDSEGNRIALHSEK